MSKICCGGEGGLGVCLYRELEKPGPIPLLSLFMLADLDWLGIDGEWPHPAAPDGALAVLR